MPVYLFWFLCSAEIYVLAKHKMGNVERRRMKLLGSESVRFRNQYCCETELWLNGMLSPGRNRHSFTCFCTINLSKSRLYQFSNSFRNYCTGSLLRKFKILRTILLRETFNETSKPARSIGDASLKKRHADLRSDLFARCDRYYNPNIVKINSITQAHARTSK